MGAALGPGDGVDLVHDHELDPGQSAPFSLRLPERGEIEVIADLDSAEAIINGSAQQTDTGLPGPLNGTLPLVGIDGFSALRLHVSTMTFDPLS